MKKRFLPLLLAIVLVCVCVLFSSCSLINSALSGAADSLIDKALSDAANEINAQCPMTVDSDTRLDNVVALPDKTLQYNYTLVKYSKSQLTEEQIAQVQSTLKIQILNTIKTSSDMKTLRDDDVTFTYVYKSNDAQELIKLTFTPQDYK